MLSQKFFEEQLVKAMKEKNAVALGVFRAVKTRLLNEKINKGEDLNEDEVMRVLLSEVKRRKESAEAFRSGDRAEMAATEEAEIAVIAEFLPKAADEDEINQKIDDIIKEQSLTKQDFGKGMSLLKEFFGARADGTVLSNLLRGKLS